MLDDTTIKGIFQQHGFVTLPQGVNSIHLAMFHYQNLGFTFYDVIAYREVNDCDETLSRQATLFNKALPQLQQYIQANPKVISPSLHYQTLSFLGRKAHILSNDNGSPIQCRLHPLLILHTTSTEFSETIVDGLPIVNRNQLASYLTKKDLFKASTPSPIHQWLTCIRRAYRYLGGSIVALPVLLGLVGLLASLEWSALSQITLIASGLIPILLLLIAIIAFNDFIKLSMCSVTISTHLPATDPSIRPSIGQPLSPLLANRETPEPIITNSMIGGAPMATAAFLQDFLERKISALIANYQKGNWRDFGEQIRAFLILGLNLSIFKHTGQKPSEDIEVLVTQVPILTVQKQLNAWFHRLDEARRGKLLTVKEAQHITNFAVHLLRQLHAIPPTWEVQIFRAIPRLSPTQIPLSKLLETASIKVEKGEAISEMPTPPSHVNFLHELVTSQKALIKTKQPTRNYQKNEG